MTDKISKLSGGQKFMAELELAAENKDDLLKLAGKVIQNSHTKRTFIERKLPENETALDMRATYAMMNVFTRKDLSTDQRLILIKQRYRKMQFGDFDKDFRKAFPKEFGVEKGKINPQVLLRARGISLTA